MNNVPPASVTSILGAIGMTPVVQLCKVVPKESADVFVKLEYFNPTGSYKDRMALAMIEEAEARGDLRPGMTVVEYTGGSTGSSLAFICAVKGYQFKVVSSDAFSKEKLDTMKAFGADLHLVPSEGGKLTPDLVPRMIEKAKSFAEQEGTYFTNQLHNADSIVGYRNIGKELLRQIDRKIFAFCGSVGTAGMLVGVSQELRRANPDVRIIALEPATSAVLSGGDPGSHHVEGIGIGFVPPLLDEGLYDTSRGIDEAEARVMARRLANQEGVFAGTSTGLNVVGALQVAKEIGEGKVVVTVAVDTGLKYLSGDLYAV
ncbi:MAG: cysteine synthase family protein [Planctomycetes bacterium]|nr:cysteine synthase family protein [Planctomycetota bacterium]